ncbi:MAG: hypothetical protein ACKO6N_08500, partial [Myxococcota bacterium]
VLAAGDRTYSGRLRMDRDAVLLRSSGALAVVIWRDGAMKVHHSYNGSLDWRWNLGPDDRFVLGDFHRLGPDVSSTWDHHIDGLSDVFIHNAWGTGMLGVNHGAPNPASPENIIDQIGITWIQAKEILWK